MDVLKILKMFLQNLFFFSAQLMSAQRLSALFCFVNLVPLLINFYRRPNVFVFFLPCVLYSHVFYLCETKCLVI